MDRMKENTMPLKQFCPAELSVMIQYSIAMLHNMVATGHTGH